jgi:hypothetical protein
MVVEMPSTRPKFWSWLAGFVEAGRTETFVGVPVVFGKIEVVLDQRSPGKSVIADAIAADPGIEKREREQEEKKKQTLGFASARSEGGAGVLLVHERDTRRMLIPFPAAVIAGSITMWSQTPKTKEGTW